MDFDLDKEIVAYELYEDLRRRHPEGLTKSWDSLDLEEKAVWVLVGVRMDMMRVSLNKAYRMCGRVMVLNPDLLPVEG